MVRHLKRIVENSLFRVLSIFPIDEKKIIFESEKDFSDNSYAVYDYLMENGYNEKYNILWAVEPNTKRMQIPTIPKWEKGIGLKRLYELATAKYYIFDHNNILSELPRRKDQIIINLFHGCPFKRGGVGGRQTTNTEDMVPVTGDFWKEIMADFIPCDAHKVISLGYPRNDYFFHKINDLQRKWIHDNNWKKYKKIILWMPTFRRSNSETISEDYYQGETGLPVIYDKNSLDELNSFLNKLNVLIVFKIHHLQMDYDVFKEKYSNIQVIKDDDIFRTGLQLYQIVALTDALITDYSSISNDYLLLNRPMIFTLDDYEEYRNSRGFSMDDPAQYFPGHHVVSKEELLDALEEISSGKDTYKDAREKLLPLMHKYQDGNSSKRIVNYVLNILVKQDVYREK